MPPDATDPVISNPVSSQNPLAIHPGRAIRCFVSIAVGASALGWLAPFLHAMQHEKSTVSDSRNPLRTTLLVPVPEEAGWQDMAFLAAIPAMTVHSNGNPSLISLDAKGEITPEVNDYLHRYRPDEVLLLSKKAVKFPTAQGRKLPGVLLEADSAIEAAQVLCAKFWQTSRRVVLTHHADYEAALIAAPLAARLRSPLLFIGETGLSTATLEEISKIKAKELILVGSPSLSEHAVTELGSPVIRLKNATDIFTWMRLRKMPVNYLAAVNPLDRTTTITRKLSLSGAMLAAGRDGLIAPLPYAVQWKLPFQAADLAELPLPKKLRKISEHYKTGVISLGDRKFSFFLPASSQDPHSNLFIDLDGNGKADQSDEGPLMTGDTVILEKKRFAISLGRKSGVEEADLRLTWPTAEQLVTDLESYYHALGAPPEYLCLVGFPDAVPQAIYNGGIGGINEDITSDFPYSNCDKDPFAEICVARVVAENASFATLYASRVLTYQALLDPKWQNRACQADWENTCRDRLENVGFEASHLHTRDDLKWLTPPSPGVEGVRARSFDQDSPLASCAALTHTSHSWWQAIGDTFDWDAEVLMAPAVVESGGCLTAALDQDSNNRSVVARILRKGAISFSGNSREGMAQGELQRQEFWNGVLAGKTIGQAHRGSINSAQVTISTQAKAGESDNNPYLYHLLIHSLFGDPAFSLHLPGLPKSAPARCVTTEEKVTVHAPAEWWPVKMHVPEDWKAWAGKDLFVLRGAGVYALRTWCKEQYDREETYFTAEFTTRRKVANIKQQQDIPAPLGWSGSYFVDEHADGSRTYRWAVRLADFDQINGKILSSVIRIDYEISYE